MEKQTKPPKNVTANEEPLGFCNVDKLKVFDENQLDSLRLSSNSHRNNKRHSIERTKTSETLQKVKMVGGQPIQNKENIHTNSMWNHSRSLNKTEYVLPCRANSINLSELITDDTINLVSNDTTSPSPLKLPSQQLRTSAAATKEIKISFEPTEITGRSTVYNHDYEKLKEAAKRKPRMSVNDIVLSSFSSRGRTLSNTLDEINNSLSSINVMREAAISRFSMGLSSFTSFNSSRSLPRTADLSKMLNSERSFDTDNHFDDEHYNSKEFAPAELMRSKLLNDEIAWSKEYATMPPTALSEEAQHKLPNSNARCDANFDVNSTTNSIDGTGDPNFSVGKFFNGRSDDIWNLVNVSGPSKCGTPIALVNASCLDADTDAEEHVSTTSSLDHDPQATPRPDNKTYKLLDANTITKKKVGQRESKDSGNSSSSSYLLSMSTIDKLLSDMEIRGNETDTAAGLMDVLFQKTKSSKDARQIRGRTSNTSSSNNSNEHTRLSVSSVPESYTNFADMILENKENLDPKLLKSADLSDTKSFTESLLNSSDINHTHKSDSSRSPLSPLQLDGPNAVVVKINDHDANDGDEDEWPSTPVKAAHRRVRRTKSPVNLASPQPSNGDNNAAPPASGISHENDQVREQGQSQGVLVTTTTMASDCNEHDATNMNGNANTAQDMAPMRSESPRDMHDMPSLLSPMDCASPVSCGSPQLDSTTSSDRRYLNPNGNCGALGKHNSSPTLSETSMRGGYPVLPSSRSCLYSSPKHNDMGATSLRSVSRCSSSSEFSHRDGKVIPLKVSALYVSWSSTKLRREVRKSMQIKNISNKRLAVRIEIHGPGFQLHNERGNIVTLQAQECRTIAIQFCPTVVGAAVGMLSFHSPNASHINNGTVIEVPLYGYGGHASIVPQGILQGPVGYPFLIMGELGELSRPLLRTFFIHNKGPLVGFAVMSVDSIGLNLPRLSNAFVIEPQFMIIPPNRVMRVNVRFQPRREDIRNIMKKITNVLTLSNLRIIYGDEANRQRMRRLVHAMSSEERDKFASRTIERLWSKFDNEPDMSELSEINEKSDVLMDLMQCVNVKEIALTLNHHSVDETLESSSLYLPDADDTIMFRTVCTASPMPSEAVAECMEDDCLVDGDSEGAHGGGSGGGGEQAVTSSSAIASAARSAGGSWSVTPERLELSAMDERHRQAHKVLIIRNTYKSRQYFEVICSKKDVLAITPCEGYIEPDGGEMRIRVNLLKPTNEPICIMIYMENERVTVPVKIVDTLTNARSD